MATPVVWQCTKCGRTTTATQKPGTGNTQYTKCSASSDGKHKWVLKQR